MDTIMFSTGAPMNEALAADLWDVGPWELLLLPV